MTSQMLCDSPCSRGTLLRAFARVAFPALCLTGALLTSGVQAQTSVTTDPVGYISTTLIAGPNLVGAGLHPTAAYRGIAGSIVTNPAPAAGTSVFTVSGTDPGWTTSPTLQFGPRDNYAQYVVIIIKDVNATASLNVEGDWWPVVSNGSNQLTVNTASHPFTIAVGDQIELRHLTSIYDLFGSTTTGTTLNKDVNGFPTASEEDVIRYIVGTSYTDTVFYHDSNGTVAPTGFYVNDNGPYDGTTITIMPDQPLMVIRKTGSSPLTMTNLGAVQMTHLTHYLTPGPNVIVTGLPADAPIGTSGLTPPASSWLSDSNGFPSKDEEDIIRVAQGASFTDTLFYHNSNGTIAPTGWYLNDTQNDAYALKAGAGYFFLLKPNSGTVVWRQNVPY